MENKTVIMLIIILGLLAFNFYYFYLKENVDLDEKLDECYEMLDECDTEWWEMYYRNEDWSEAYYEIDYDLAECYEKLR